MGFRAEVENFQPFYVFQPSPKKLADLRIGASVLEETLNKIETAREQAKLNRVDPKAAARAVALKVCSALFVGEFPSHRRGVLVFVSRL